MGIRRPVTLLLMMLSSAVVLLGCEASTERQAKGLSDAAIIDSIATRPNMEPQPASYAVAPVSFRRQMRFIVRNHIDDEPIACGYARLPPAGRFEVEPLVAFVAKGDTVYLAADLPADEFAKMQTNLCGPAWVEPLVQSPRVHL
jgi:hypothetical protein